MTAPYRKKLIEVALPLEAINRESAREKSIRHGHPSTLHLWWARRPLAACRAVLFASIVGDPSSRPDLFRTEEDQEAERQRLFRLIEELVKWENTTNEQVLASARAEILKATDGHPPPVLDPFCGGGSIPLEAQRLGLEVHASDLNPVAVLITKALVEIPPKFGGRPPVNPDARAKLGHGASWEGARGLADDVRYYSSWIRSRAFDRIGHLYPKEHLPDGSEATVIAWLWTRTLRCPNPACGAQMPLVRSFALSTKNGKETSVHPVVENGKVRFEVASGPPARGGTKQRGEAECIVCETKLSDAVLRKQALAHGMRHQPLAIVAEVKRRRVYLTAPENVNSPKAEATPWLDASLPVNARWFSPPGYGLTTYRDLFTQRQLIALMRFSDLVGDARDCVLADSGDDDAYADAVATYLGLAVSKLADYNSSLVVWSQGRDQAKATFARQALPMVWDFVEVNPFARAAGDLMVSAAGIAETLERLPSSESASVRQLDATVAVNGVTEPAVCTDPPYYDNIGYADLSDYFYVWLRRSLGSVHPDIFSTLLTPKSQELVATPYRFAGNRHEADRFFEDGLRRAFDRIHEAANPSYPMTLFYAFKQAEETGDAGIVSTGWDTMLKGLIDAGFAVTGTWPMRTERAGRTIEIGTNALASSIVLVCRARPTDASVTSRRDFVAALRAELPGPLRQLQRGSIAPVDLAQAAIGPGMAVFSRYAKVIEANGDPMTVRTALGLINQALDEILAEQEGDFDADTRFAVSWFEHRGTSEGPYGEADVLARAKNTSVHGLEEAGILHSRAGKVRLLGRDELPSTWDPAADRRLTVWEVAQHLIGRLETGGEISAAELLRRVGGIGETARELAYRLYTICERKGWAQEALGYNAIVVAWPELARLAGDQQEASIQQTLGG